MKLLDHLSRITTPGRTFIPQIDGLRFVAILSVIAYHVRSIALFHFNVQAPFTGKVVHDIFDSGHFGVQLFFAISGFVLSLPFARALLGERQPLRLRDYFMRRLTRIEPPYVIHLAFLFLLCVFVLRRMPAHAHLYQNNAWAGYTGAHLLSSLGYANGFIFQTHPYPNVVLWSLEVEVQFYILAPFLARVFAIRGTGMRRAVILGVMALSTLVSAQFGERFYLVGYSLIGNLQYFFIGFLLVDFYLAGRLDGARNFKWDLLFPLACAGLVVIQNTGLAFLVPCCVLGICLTAFRGRFGAAFMSNRWIITIGGMCYSIYLYHWFLISLLIRGTAALQTKIVWLDLIVQLLVMAPAILLVGVVLFVFFERPFMRRDWPARAWAAIGHPQVSPATVDAAPSSRIRSSS